MSADVLVVGSINRDDAIGMTRLPGPGETITADTFTQSLGGKGANQAIAAARAGAAVRMVGAVGPDGDDLISALAADSIDVDDVARHGGPSGHAVVLVDADAENSIVVVPGANRHIPRDAVTTAAGSLQPGDVLVLQHEVPVEVSRIAAEAASRVGATVIWNAAPAPITRAELISAVDLLVVNEHELAAVAALLEVEPSAGLEATVRAVAAEMRVGVVCTLGADGAASLVAGVFTRAPSRRVQAVDTTAAGDTFVGYLAATADQPFPERLRTALDAAAMTVTRPGASASIPTIDEVGSTDTSQTGLTSTDAAHPDERTTT